ncbi:hypothetical protein [Alicyclobacillus acidoterrestris]|uniref:Uncharacterized protein n=1 Tax=Alicyclobacillus acidoterrestris (strain ATCC 49025 / DSM 3922 / CIP 106132 / NCIMB 13137 / GD3B) TaxID=1356854 RepID=A0A9E6ZUP7_ALIAG|nr:hypothetical protein [Alicyclobacillus acidoterrestris]UNO49519.1 hypothetical protein K1I37_02920 [Alicyclobacillus acidoterrestris]
MARRWSGRLDAVQGRGARFDAWCLTWCLGAWVLGCLGAWVLGCLGAWVLGCLAPDGRFGLGGSGALG